MWQRLKKLSHTASSDVWGEGKGQVLSAARQCQLCVSALVGWNLDNGRLASIKRGVGAIRQGICTMCTLYIDLECAALVV